MTQKKIAILGAGANGSAIGADLTRAGEDVVLIEQWPAHVEAMRANGLRVELPNETLTTPVEVIHLCEVAELRTRFDYVFMLMKAYDSKWAAHLIEPYLAEDGLLVGVQNGMTAETIQDVVGPARTLGCVIEITSMMFEPGVVERHSPADRSWFAVGALDQHAAEREQEVADLLRRVGSVEVVDNIRAAKWMKLVSNSTTLATTAILGVPMIEAAQIPEMRRFMLQCGQEALKAGAILGLPILPIFGLTPDAVSRPDQAVETLLDTLLTGFVLPSSKTTVLQDWMKGRRSEAKDINGAVVRILHENNQPSPANDAVVDLALRIESRQTTPGMHNLLTLLAAAG